MSDNLPKTQQNQGKKMCERRLYNIAVYYLERYASSSHQLRQVLKRRVMKDRIRGQEINNTEATEWIDAVIEKLTKQGFLNDQVFAESKTRSLSSRGKSIKMIQMTLKQKGLGSDMIDQAMDQIEDASHDLSAAVRLVKKKKIGHLRPKSQQKDNYQKDLATLARQGFSYATAVKALSLQDADDDVIDPIFSS